MNLVDESWIWHRRLEHIKLDNLVKVSNLEAVRNLPKISKPSNPICRHCQLGKQTRIRLKKKSTQPKNLYSQFTLTSMDIQGPKFCKENPTLCCSLMILLEWLGYLFSRKNNNHLTSSKPLKSLLKMKQRKKSNVLDQTMVMSLPLKSLISSVKPMELRDNSLLPEHLSKMGLLRGEIEQFRRLQRLCSMKQNCLMDVGGKL